MVNQNMRDALDAYGEDHDISITMFEDPSFDESIIGISDDGRLIYNYNHMIVELAHDEQIDEIEAEEFIQYNTIRACPYQQNPPIIMDLSVDELMAIYR